METGTLKELNVKPGDLVECVGEGTSFSFAVGEKYLVTKSSDGRLECHGVSYGIKSGKCDWKFRIVSRASDPDTPKLWRYMTPEEKGALLLAHHEGKVIEFEGQGWHKVAFGDPGWYDYTAYRVSPEPKRETVTLYFGELKQGALLRKVRTDTHRITFDLIDGKPDPDSIRIKQV